MPLPEPPRDLRTFASELAEDLEWFYRIAREVIMHKHKRAESRYNERVVERVYQPGCIVRVLQHGRNRNVPSKLDAQYSGLCEVLEVRGALLTLRELATQRVFTANHDAVRMSTMTRPAVPQAPQARAAPHPLMPRVAPAPSHNSPPCQAQAQPQLPTHAAPLQSQPPANALAPQPQPQAIQQAPPYPALLPTTHPPPSLRANQQARAPAATRRRAPAPPESREASHLPPFGSPAVLPPHLLYKKKVRRNTRRGTNAPVP